MFVETFRRCHLLPLSPLDHIEPHLALHFPSRHAQMPPKKRVAEADASEDETGVTRASKVAKTTGSTPKKPTSKAKSSPKEKAKKPAAKKVAAKVISPFFLSSCAQRRGLGYQQKLTIARHPIYLYTFRDLLHCYRARCQLKSSKRPPSLSTFTSHIHRLASPRQTKMKNPAPAAIARPIHPRTQDM